MKDQVRCQACGCTVHATRLESHPCDYLRRNLMVAKAEGVKAEARYILGRLEGQKRVPAWLIDSIQCILDWATPLPKELAAYRNQEPRE